MNDQEKTDQWLRESLKDYRPSVSNASRQRFLSEVSTGIDKGSRTGYLYLAVVFLLVFSFSGIFLWWPKSELVVRNNAVAEKQKITNINSKTTYKEQAKLTGTMPDSPEKQISEQAVKSSNKLFKQEASILSALPEQELKQQRDLQRRNQNRGTLNTNIAVPTAIYSFPDILQITVSEESASTVLGSPPVSEESASTAIESPPASEGSTPSIMESASSSKEDIPVDVTRSPTSRESVPADKKVPDSRRPRNRSDMSLYLYYRPELVCNIIDGEKLMHSYGVEYQTRFFNGKYLLGTGVGLMQSKGYYEYAIDYKEFLGNYQKLDYITFNWNPENFIMQHTCHTTEQVVFDTLVKTNYTRIYRNFVYLQVPLIMGYDLIHKEGYSLGLRFNPILSILLSKKAVNLNYEAGKNQVIQINRITTDRVRTNWQLATGINYSRKLSGSLLLEIEPRFIYYFNSVYEKSDNSSSPLGFSVRVAIGIQY